MEARERLTTQARTWLTACLAARARGEPLPTRDEPDGAAARDRAVVHAYDDAQGLHADGAKEELARRLRVTRGAREACRAAEALRTDAGSATEASGAAEAAMPHTTASAPDRSAARSGAWRILLPDGRLVIRVQ